MIKEQKHFWINWNRTSEDKELKEIWEDLGRNWEKNLEELSWKKKLMKLWKEL